LSGENAWQVLDAGANAIVAGSHVFHAPDYGRAISSIRKSMPARPDSPRHSREKSM
jgi:ribulose-phosphate 3-epimerase